MASFVEIVRDRVEELGVPPTTLALQSGLKRDAIRSVLRGFSPSVDRVPAICDALGLEFYIGPERGSTALGELETSHSRWRSRDNRGRTRSAVSKSPTLPELDISLLSECLELLLTWPARRSFKPKEQAAVVSLLYQVAAYHSDPSERRESCAAALEQMAKFRLES